MNPPSGQHLTQLQPMQKATPVRRTAPTATATSSTPVHDGERDTSFNLSSLVKDTVGLSDTSFASDHLDYFKDKE